MQKEDPVTGKCWMKKWKKNQEDIYPQNLRRKLIEELRLTNL